MLTGESRSTGLPEGALRPLAFLLVLALAATALAGCEEEPVSVSEAERQRIVAELDDRSFRQFEPHRDGNPRKGVILDFFNGISLWAQYGEDGHAVNEWDIHAESYRVEARGSEYILTFNDPRSYQQFPTECEDCIPTTGVSISVRDLFDKEKIAFRVNDPEGDLPLPFPVFGSWTRFGEDEYQSRVRSP